MRKYINMLIPRLLFSNFRHPRVFSEEKIYSCYKKKYFDEVVATPTYKEVYKAANDFVEKWEKTTGKEYFKKRYSIGSYQKYTFKVDVNILFNKNKSKCIIPILFQMTETKSRDNIIYIVGEYSSSKWNFNPAGGMYVIAKAKSFEEISRESLARMLDDGYMSHLFCKIAYSYIDNHSWFKSSS